MVDRERETGRLSAGDATMIVEHLAMNSIYQSEILGVIHEEAEANYAVGGISRERMYRYDEDCLIPGAIEAVRMARESTVQKAQTVNAFRLAV